MALITYMPELDYRKEMRDHIRRLDYYLSENGITRACQKISDELNRANYDIHGVWVSMSQIGPAQGHFHHFQVEAEGSIFYVRVAVD